MQAICVKVQGTLTQRENSIPETGEKMSCEESSNVLSEPHLPEFIGDRFCTYSEACGCQWT
jgi:hypothetical protein